ncbi:hypothetical protein PFICI_06037 [Pestalotiopsis fici W106-1]|uniref:Uncharacterized protein n=1 Tax=Pestalotiopsis fici (strain W106-1 / CGMCC3.15140) TaxID=1229662 RepID=W3X4Q0_PESFW|nr:uncharacterized protein PFICI_06037 [Pestalotiopsis fici W106-1]ETS81035.1 hypothetical protein PFICI_06037 [Pestalotiopsis fici W106-1]
MKANTIYSLALAFAITPALSAVIGNNVTPRDNLPKRLINDHHEFPDKVKCPKTDAGDEFEFKQDQMEKTADEWKDIINDKQRIGGEKQGGYPARYALGSPNGNANAQAFWANTQKMQFSDDCLKGWMWEVPLLDSGNVWSTDGNNGDAGPYRLYFLAKDGELTYCGSAIHASNDPTKGSEFERCEADD